MKIINSIRKRPCITPNTTSSPITTTALAAASTVESTATLYILPTFDGMLRQHRDILISLVEEKSNREPSTGEIWIMAMQFFEKYPQLCDHLEKDGVAPVSIKIRVLIYKYIYIIL